MTETETVFRCAGCGVWWDTGWPDNEDECPECGTPFPKVAGTHVLMPIAEHAALRGRAEAAEARVTEKIDALRTALANLVDEVAAQPLADETGELAARLDEARAALAGSVDAPTGGDDVADH